METLVAIIYFTVQGTTPGGRFLRSVSHRALDVHRRDDSCQVERNREARQL